MWATIQLCITLYQHSQIIYTYVSSIHMHLCRSRMLVFIKSTETKTTELYGVLNESPRQEYLA